jgi:hypothetical protein
LKKSLLIFLSLLPAALFGQLKPVTITAHVVGEDHKPMSNVMVINKRSNQGFIAEIDGSFKTAVLKTDTLTLLCRGFNDLLITFRDSLEKQVYPVTIMMRRKVYLPKDVNIYPQQKNHPPVHDKKDSLAKDTFDDYYSSDAYKLKQVTVYGAKTPDVIRKEIDSLGVRNTDDYKSYNSMGSPITALYERFSKREQDKRKVAELENEDRKKEVLRDLLVLYVSYDIVNLTDAEFNEFLNGLYVPDEVLKNYNDYELGEFIKKQYMSFRSYKKQQYDYRSTQEKFHKGN